MWQKRSCTKVSITDVSNNACKINSVVRQAGFAKKNAGKKFKECIIFVFFQRKNGSDITSLSRRAMEP